LADEEIEMSSSSADEPISEEEEANEAAPRIIVPNRGNRDGLRPNPPMRERYGDVVIH
jgi:hypothetical protein